MREWFSEEELAIMAGVYRKRDPLAFCLRWFFLGAAVGFWAALVIGLAVGI